MQMPHYKGFEQAGKGIEISATEKVADISFHNLELNAQNTTSPEIEVTVKKESIELREGESYCHNAVIFDRETDKMKTLAVEAAAFSELPENERPARILELLRSRMHYAYNDAIERLSETEPERAKWVAANTGLNAPYVPNVPLSELVEKGYGVCRHLSAAYLWLAQKAGLKGVFLNSDGGVLRNIERSDTKEKLFKSTEIGKSLPAHTWVEIKTSAGQWVPVDPSTQLVGDSEEKLAMFREANYMANGNLGLDVDAEPRDQLGTKGTPILFAPAKATATGTYCLELFSSKPRISSGHGSTPATNIPYSGQGRLKIRTSESGGLGLDLVEVKEK